jgi:C-terminal processing protease CtpA/Prc
MTRTGLKIPTRTFAKLSLALVAVAALCLATRSQAQSFHLVQLSDQPNPLLVHTTSQGYLGVDLADVDAEHQQALKLKELRGAVITLIDHDAPAGKIGLQVNDVILELNKQTVEGSEQLKRMLREIPAGHKVELLVSRDGNKLHFEAQLADRRMIARDLQQQIQSQGSYPNSTPGMGILGSSNGVTDFDSPSAGFFHWWTGGASLNVGATVEPLTAQIADYLGLQNGLMVKAIIKKSEAERAGLKPHDIILKVGNDSVATIADWERALHTNQDKPVPLTILRDKKQLTLTLQVDSKHHKSSTTPVSSAYAT